MRTLDIPRIGALVALLLVGCSSPVGPPALTPDEVAGQYVLVALTGEPVGETPGQVSGEVRLHPLGAVERRLTYHPAAGDPSATTLVGSYSLQGRDLQLTLLDGTYAWRPSVTLGEGVLTITSPSPADGPDIVERYERRLIR